VTDDELVMMMMMMLCQSVSDVLAPSAGLAMHCHWLDRHQASLPAISTLYIDTSSSIYSVLD